MANGALPDTIRIALLNAELSRKGPGVLLRDIVRGDDPQVAAVAKLLASVQPDIVVLLGIDHDYEGSTLNAFRNVLAATSLDLPYQFTRPPNRGLQTGQDLNGNGTVGEPDDAHGYGEFTGQGGMAILSRFEIARTKTKDFTTVLWRDLPDNLYPEKDGSKWGGAQVHNMHRLSTTGHWVIPIKLPDANDIQLLVWHATPPVFDGTEDRNGRRNHDETAFWLHYLRGAFGPAPEGPIIIIGTANLDPDRGEGRKEALSALLQHTQLQDPFPGITTVDWPPPGPGKMRVDYILPSAQLKVLAKGIKTDPAASRHSLLWIDVALFTALTTLRPRATPLGTHFAGADTWRTLPF